jgi:hypothetical protein
MNRVASDPSRAFGRGLPPSCDGIRSEMGIASDFLELQSKVTSWR